jgi:stage II sporulation protein D
MNRYTILIGVVGFVLLLFLIPILLVDMESDAAQTTNGKRSEDSARIRVYLTKEKRVIEVPLEEYVQGVVAAEMPADFHLEALKTQALAARTYIVYRLQKGSFSDMQKWGTAAETAYVTDTVQHQVYLTDKQLQRIWGKEYEEKRKKIAQAVEATRGQILTYKGKPIYAAFFSTSNGKTENSEDYFSTAYPYLRSVDSPWDQESPKYKQQKSFAIKEVMRKLEEKTGKKIAIPAFQQGTGIKVITRTEGGRVGKIRIGDQIFTGREVREALQLSSSDFTWHVAQDRIVFTTYGYGHGVGLSQWGANLMAQQGKTAQEIVAHYYRGVSIQQVELTESANRLQVKIRPLK